MRAIRKKLTLGNLMIAVVAFALSLRLGQAYNRSPRYWEEYRLCARLAASTHNVANLYESGAVVLNPDTPEKRRENVRVMRNFANFTDRKANLYRRAAFFPWLPDTPELPYR